MASCTSPSHWDDRFFAMAQLVSSWSKDRNKQVGAVLVSPDCRHVSIGYNGLPAMFEETIGADVIMDKATKNRYSLHAETNVLAQVSANVSGWTMYITEPPCLSCALAIHRAGVARVLTPSLNQSSSWFEDQEAAEGFLSAMQVKQERYSG
jgi:dCMP deaminase